MSSAMPFSCPSLLRRHIRQLSKPGPTRQPEAEGLVRGGLPAVRGPLDPARRMRVRRGVSVTRVVRVRKRAV